MSNINIINKKNPMDEKEIKLKLIDDGKDNDSSFNQLLALQLLIQKHSGLKELCKI